MKRILIVGGASGIGLAMASELASREEVERVYVVDKDTPPEASRNGKIEAMRFDLTNEDYSLFDRFQDIDAMMVTAGFGRLALFSDVSEKDIELSFQVNTIAAMRIVRRFYHRLEGQETFRCGVMVSIAGYMSSPFYSVYAATKAALRVFIESVNVELEKSGTRNRILNVSPGAIKGTKFHGSTENQLELVMPLAREIIDRLDRGDDLFIPQYEEIYRNVLERYHNDFRAEGRHSYEYKLEKLRK